MDKNPILAARGLKRYYSQKGGFLKARANAVRAVDGVDLSMQPGKILGLVGESGCGKSTLARLLLKLEEPDAGELLFNGEPLRRASLEFRRQVQAVFQDPFGTLDPRFTIENCIKEGLRYLFPQLTRAESEKKVAETLAAVGLPDTILERFPHEFSGGQRQRIGIARALVLNPKLLICDEPVSSLDVSVQAQIINLLKTLNQERGLTVLIITHNLGVVSALAHEVAVMQAGRIVEQGPVQGVIKNPKHSYTKTLMEAVPRLVS